MYVPVVMVARSTSLAVLSALGSATVGTTGRYALFASENVANAKAYLLVAMDSYTLAVPLGIAFNLLWLALPRAANSIDAAWCRRFAFLSTLSFWLISGYASAVYVKNLPCEKWLWCATTLGFGTLSALAAAKLCAEGLDYLGLLDR